MPWTGSIEKEKVGVIKSGSIGCEWTAENKANLNSPNTREGDSLKVEWISSQMLLGLVELLALIRLAGLFYLFFEHGSKMTFVILTLKKKYSQYPTTHNFFH